MEYSETYPRERTALHNDSHQTGCTRIYLFIYRRFKCLLFSKLNNNKNMKIKWNFFDGCKESKQQRERERERG